MMMWLLTVFAEIPQLNLGIWFLHQSDETTSDPEKMRLSGPAAGLPSYTAQVRHGTIETTLRRAETWVGIRMLSLKTSNWCDV